MTIDDLMQQIKETERLIAVYRNADEIIVGTEDQIYSRRELVNRTSVTNHRPKNTGNIRCSFAVAPGADPFAR